MHVHERAGYPPALQQLYIGQGDDFGNRKSTFPASKCAYVKFHPYVLVVMFCTEDPRKIAAYPRAYVIGPVKRADLRWVQHERYIFL